MLTYFRGWRRKIGVMTLVIACALLLVWMRSRVVEVIAPTPDAGAVTLERIARVQNQNSSPIRQIALSPSGRRFAAIHEDGLLDVWDTEPRARLFGIKNAGNGRALAFLNDQEIATTWGEFYDIADPAILVWSCETHLLEAKLPIAKVKEANRLCVLHKPERIVSGAVNPNGGYAIDMQPDERSSGTIELWTQDDLTRFQTLDVNKFLGWDIALFHPRKDISDWGDDVAEMAVSSQGSHILVVGGIYRRDVIALFNGDDGSLVWRQSLKDSFVTSCCLCRHDTSIAVSIIPQRPSDGEQVNQDTICILSIESGDVRRRWSSGQPRVTSLASSDDFNIVATGGNDGQIRLWNSSDGTLVTSFDSGLPEVTSLRINDERRILLACSHNGEIIVCKVNRNRKHPN